MLSIQKKLITKLINRDNDSEGHMSVQYGPYMCLNSRFPFLKSHFSQRKMLPMTRTLVLNIAVKCVECYFLNVNSYAPVISKLAYKYFLVLYPKFLIPYETIVSCILDMYIIAEKYPFQEFFHKH